MQATETKVKDLLEGTKQYVVPLFQRTYSWEKREWEMLWNDISELYEDNDSNDHFMGSIVTIPVQSKPEGVPKYLLIDGQQRLTTIYILLTALRDNSDEQSLVDEINTHNILNPERHARNNANDKYKLLPTQNDRNIFFNILTKNNQNAELEAKLSQAYIYYLRKIGTKKYNLEKLLNVLLNKLSVVSITLDKDDNPYLIFESLNYKGRPLTQGDLIRNYFFMKIYAEEQDEIYNSLWQPIQETLEDNLTEFIRHFLMKDGKEVKKREIYSSLKEIVDKKNRDEDNAIIDYLKELFKYSQYYTKLLNPNKEVHIEIKNKLLNLNKFEVTTAYPFLLNIYELFAQNVISSTEFVEVLGIIENFVIRRYICLVPTNTLNKIFPVLFKNIDKENIIHSLKNELKTKNYPTNQQFIENLIKTKLYSSSSNEANNKTRIILESLELSFLHKEKPSFDNLSLEHIMPQTLNSDWINDLGENHEENYSLLLHTLGNLTLTGYNSELSNVTFDKKKIQLERSNLELNKYFKNVEKWDYNEILKRAEVLSEKALMIWPSLWGDEEPLLETVITSSKTGTKPSSITILGQEFTVDTWREVLVKTLENLFILDEEKFEKLTLEFEHRISKTGENFRSPYKLTNSYYIETNLSAESIKRFCSQVINEFELAEEDWQVKI